MLVARGDRGASSMTYFTKDTIIYDHALIGAYVPPCLTDPKFCRGVGGRSERGFTTFDTIHTKTKQNKKTCWVSVAHGSPASTVGPLGLLLFSSSNRKDSGKLRRWILTTRTHTHTHVFGRAPGAIVPYGPAIPCGFVERGIGGQCGRGQDRVVR